MNDARPSPAPSLPLPRRRKRSPLSSLPSLAEVAVWKLGFVPVVPYSADECEAAALAYARATGRGGK